MRPPVVSAAPSGLLCLRCVPGGCVDDGTRGLMSTTKKKPSTKKRAATVEPSPGAKAKRHQAEDCTCEECMPRCDCGGAGCRWKFDAFPPAYQRRSRGVLPADVEPWRSSVCHRRMTVDEMSAMQRARLIRLTVTAVATQAVQTVETYTGHNLVEVVGFLIGRAVTQRRRR